MTYVYEAILFLILINNIFIIQTAEKPFAFSSYIPIPARQTASEIFNYTSDIIVSSAGSLFETTRNAMSDDAALEKLEWPKGPQTKEARKRNSEIYTQISMQKYTQNNSAEIFDFIERRRRYLMRAVQLLPTRPDGLFIAEHCLRKHGIVMDEFLKNQFLDFIRATKKDVEDVSQAINQFLLDK
jgi:hypothetical protein